jgi:hypothetical protein
LMTYNDMNLNGLRYSLSGNLILDINEKFSLDLSYQKYSVKIDEFSSVGNSMSGEKGGCNSLALNLIYYFKNRYYQKVKPGDSIL